MLKKLLIIILALNSIQSLAQIPVLTATTNPDAGDWQVVYSTDTFNFYLPMVTGAGLTWHFDTLHSYHTDTTFFGSCSASPYCTDFPGSSIFIYNHDDSISTYYNNTSSAMTFTGEYNTVPIYYSNNEDLLRYPFSYDSAYTDTFYSVFTTGGYTYRRNGTISVRARGYGTLMLPTATYSNALAVYSFETFTDSTVVSGSPFAYSYETLSMTWYVPDIRVELLNQVRYIRDGTLIGISSYYTTPTATAVKQTNAPGMEVSLNPNPASDQISINCGSIPGPGSWVAVYNISGQRVAMCSLTGTDTVIPISQLTHGLYFCKISVAGQEVQVKRFVVER